MNEQYVKASLKEAQVGLDALINNEAMIGRIAACLLYTSDAADEL